ncbi:hypothetical protein G6F56_010216 [Rhizopus delemar]|nr:hypothetical protein G6F56_010216 [Rhizopus delemar]
MSSQHIQAYSRIKIERPRSTIFSWIFGDNADKDSSKVEEEKTDEKKARNSLHLNISPPPLPSHDPEPLIQKNPEDISSEIKIPARHQSRIYTPFHNETLFAEENDKNSQEYKRRSCYSARLSTNIQSSSLTRSASWQPSSSSNSNIDQRNVLQCIPDRRTSRNYAQDPDIQAKLNEMIQSEKTLKVTQMIAHSQQLH